MSYFLAALTLAHLALAAALIRARPAGEMRRLGAVLLAAVPFRFAHRALCAAAIFARDAALIVRGPRDRPALSNRLSASIAVSNPFNCRATLSLSVLNSAMMSIGSPSGEDCSKPQPRTMRLAAST
jgi:hypothetical protein